MKEQPTPFQLAQLAAQASPPHTKPKDAVRRARELWNEAEAEVADHEKRVAYLRSLFSTPAAKDIPIFTDSPEDWQARLKAYPGDERDVERALWEHEFSNEEVQKQLFKDKTHGRDARRKLFLGLARACIIFDLPGPPRPYAERFDYLKPGAFVAPVEKFPIHPTNLERAKANHNGAGEMLIPENEVRFVKEIEAMLSKPQLYAHLVRWAVEVRQKQLASSKSRLIPESIRTRSDDRDTGENIQVKRPHRE